MEAFSKTRIPGEARQVLDFIIRKTYGWHKKYDFISLSQFVDGTGLRKPTVCKAIKKLLQMNLIITQKDNGIATSYSFNKHFNKWNLLPKKITLPKKEIRGSQKGNQGVPKKGHTKETITKETITKETITKETPVDFFSPGHQEHLEIAKEILAHLETATGHKNEVDNYAKKLITAHLRNGYHKEQFIAVIDKKNTDPGFQKQYMRPETLFSEKLFDKYINENESDYQKPNQTQVEKNASQVMTDGQPHSKGTPAS